MKTTEMIAQMRKMLDELEGSPVLKEVAIKVEVAHSLLRDTVAISRYLMTEIEGTET